MHLLLLSLLSFVIFEHAAVAEDAVKVAPGVIATGAHEGAFAFTPDGRSLFFLRLSPGNPQASLFVSEREEHRIYAFGGDGVHTSVYDPRADRWTEAAPLDMPRFESAVVVYGGEIWLAGGHGVRSDLPMDGDITPTVVRFDPRRNAWSRGPDLPWQRAGCAAAAVDGRLLLFGGLQPGTIFRDDPSVLEYRKARTR